MRFYGRISNDVAESNYYLSIYYLKLRDTIKSEYHCREALDIRKDLYSDDHPELAMSTYFLGKLFEKTEKKGNGKAEQEAAKKVFIKTKTTHLSEEIDELF